MYLQAQIQKNQNHSLFLCALSFYARGHLAVFGKSCTFHQPHYEIEVSALRWLEFRLVLAMKNYFQSQHRHNSFCQIRCGLLFNIHYNVMIN